ncbi:MAG: hypothetical protein R2754_00450 [Microthrixaceae bacterium]
MWRGSITIDGDVALPLAIMGRRGAPDPDAVALAQGIHARFGQWRSVIEAALLDEAPDADAAAGEPPLPCYAAVIAIDGRPTVELGYRVPWDDEHTLGVTMREDQVVDINGSVLEP